MLVFAFQDINVIQIAGQTVEVETKADDEFFGDFETYVIGFDRLSRASGLKRRVAILTSFGP